MSDKLRIHAIIPDGEQPESILVDSDGNYPSQAFSPERHTTIEGVVDAIGRELGKRALSVAVRKPNTPDGGIVYRTKPAPDITPPDGYAWRLALDGEA